MQASNLINLGDSWLEPSLSGGQTQKVTENIQQVAENTLVKSEDQGDLKSQQVHHLEE